MKTWCVMKPEAPVSYRGVQADAYSGDPLGYAGGSRPFPQLCADLNNGKWASKRPGESMQNFPNINMYGIIGVHIYTYIYIHIILSYTVCVYTWEREREIVQQKHETGLLWQVCVLPNHLRCLKWGIWAETIDILLGYAIFILKNGAL